MILRGSARSSRPSWIPTRGMSEGLAMKTLRAPNIILGLLYFGLLVSLAYSAGELPERVATHFDAGGQPNGWMSRHGHIIFILLLGLALPLLVAGSFFCLRFFPGRGINVPH